ncbi:MAG: hypothetical protein AB1938_27805 [Myxococcota bacterium]
MPPLLVVLALAAAPKVVAPEWTGVDVKKELLTFSSASMAESLRAAGLEVVTAQDIATVLGLERQRQLLGCGDESTSCMTELANALGCDATLVVNLARFQDGGFSGIARLLSPRDGATIASAKLTGASERELLESIEAAGALLAARMLSSRQAPPVQEVTSSGRRGPRGYWWIPGAAGIVGLGVGAGLLVSARGAYDGLGESDSYAQAQQAASSGAQQQTAGFIAVGVGSACLAAAAVMFFWPEAPVAPAVAPSPGGASVSLGGVF